MAKKTIFSGIINGKEYHNVAEYNAVMTKLLDAGEQVCASTSTKTIEICDTCNNENCTCSSDAAATAMSDVNMLPGFNPEPLVSLYNEFITDNEATDLDKLNQVRKYHKEMYPKIVNNIKNMEPHELAVYKKQVNEILKGLSDETNELEDNIKDTTKELNDFYRYKDVLAEYLTLYRNIVDVVYANTCDEEACDTCSVCGKETCECESTKQVDLANVAKMFDGMFGGLNKEEVEDIQKFTRAFLKMLGIDAHNS